MNLRLCNLFYLIGSPANVGWREVGLCITNAAWRTAAVRARSAKSRPWCEMFAGYQRSQETTSNARAAKQSLLPAPWLPTAYQAGCGSSIHAKASRTAALPSLIGETACAGSTVSKSSAKMASSHLRDSCRRRHTPRMSANWVRGGSSTSDTASGRSARLGVLVVQRLGTSAELVVEAVHLRDPLSHGAAGIGIIDLQGGARRQSSIKMHIECPHD